MSVIKVPTNFNIELEFEVPEFFRRFFALLIDIILEYLYLVLVFQLLHEIERSSNLSSDDVRYNFQAVELIIALPVMLYHIGCELLFNGQSLGKKIFGLRVVDENGGKAGISQYVIRWLLRLSDLWLVAALVFFIQAAISGNPELIFIAILIFGFLITDLLLVASSKKGQRLGDILAHTIIIRTRQHAKIEETVFQEVELHYQPVFPEIMKLGDKDINAIKNIASLARKKNDYEMADNAAYKIKTHLHISSELDPLEFLDTLLKDYNYISVNK